MLNAGMAGATHHEMLPKELLPAMGIGWRAVKSQLQSHVGADNRPAVLSLRQVFVEALAHAGQGTKVAEAVVPEDRREKKDSRGVRQGRFRRL